MTTAGGAAPHLLVFEPKDRGHPSAWLDLILRHLHDRSAPFTLSLVVAPELAVSLSRWTTVDLGFDLRLIALDDREVRLCRHRSAVVGSFGRWWTMRRYLRLTGADHGHFLEFDPLSLALALGIGFGGCKVSGILFRPSVHYPRVGTRATKIRDWIRDVRKDLLYRLMLRNPAVRTVLTLDPYFPQFAKARYGAGGKVQALPDPDCSTTRVGSDETGLADQLPPGRVAMVLFGALDRRKGVLTLLDAVRRLDPDIAARLALIVAGRIDAATATEATALTRRIADERPEAWVRIAARHLADGEIAALVGRCDLVLIPYQRFVGSSGVLLWATAAGKPVLAPDYGLLGRLVREHRLGMTTDTTDARCLADALSAAVRRSPDSFFDPLTTRRFSDAHAPATFARAVVGQVSGDAPVTGREPAVTRLQSLTTD